MTSNVWFSLDSSRVNLDGEKLFLSRHELKESSEEPERRVQLLYAPFKSKTRLATLANFRLLFREKEKSCQYQTEKGWA